MNYKFALILLFFACFKLNAQTNEETIAVEKIEQIFNSLNGNILNYERMQILLDNLMQLDYGDEVLLSKTNYLDPGNRENLYGNNTIFNKLNFISSALNKVIKVEIDKEALYIEDRLKSNFLINIELFYRNNNGDLIENYLTVSYHYAKIITIYEHAEIPSEL